MPVFRWPGGWDPFGGLRAVHRELDRLMGRSPFGQVQRVGGGTFPPVNVFDGEDETIVQCEMAGVRQGDVEVSITGETLVIKGSKKPPSDEEKLRYQRRERGVGEFSRTVVLPDKVDADRVEAALTAGVLTIRLPKSEAAKPKRIPVS